MMSNKIIITENMRTSCYRCSILPGIVLWVFKRISRPKQQTKKYIKKYKLARQWKEAPLGHISGIIKIKQWERFYFKKMELDCTIVGLFVSCIYLILSVCVYSNMKQVNWIKTAENYCDVICKVFALAH